MKLDLTSFAFGFKIADSAGNPNWATSLGQGAEYKINDDGTTCELLKGLVYSSIPLSSVETRIGKGGKLYRCDDPLAAVVLASCFTKVYVNGVLVDKCRMILLLTRDTSKSHEGRLRLKYTPHNTLVDATGKALFSNVESFSWIRKSLGLAEKACWFVYDLNVKNQDELHLSIAVAKKSGCAAYESTTSLHKKWHSLIPIDDAMERGAVEGANSGGDDALFEPPKDADHLTIALKLFQRQRAGDGWIGSESSEAMRQEFIDWCVKVDGKAKATPLTYLPPLVSVSKPLEVESMKSSWNGVYEFIFGKKPAKHVLEVTSAAELDAVYGDLLKVYDVNDLPMPGGANAANWNKVRAWVKADKVKGSKAVIIHASAFAKYRKFLEWRESEGDVAKGGPNGWTSYDAWAKAARETFAKVDAGMLIAADFDYADFARKFVYNPTVANAFFKDHKENDKREVGNFISQNRQTPKAASWYLEKDNLPAVKGLGVGCALNFMMKVRPAEFATYSPTIDKALMSVGLLAKPLPDEPTVESYEQSKALQGQVLAKMHELHIGKAADDESAADYLTVNEFAWWLSDEKNKNLVKEKVMSEQLKPVDSKKTVIKGDRALPDAFKDDEMLKRLAAALRTKPFAILAGHSGTGKSQLVRRLAYMTCNNQKLIDEGKDKTAPGNYCMVQVKPNWHDSTDLLGYYSDLGTRHFVNTAFVQFLCKAYAYPETPFFLCLDEMNLAPVEQYFAEYLSAVESLEKKGCDWVSDSLIEVVKTGEKDENGNAKVDEEILGQIIAGAQSTEAADWIRKHGLTIPKNLFVVGTVNMDETTCQFSRKVLDRAMTLLMNEVKFAEMGKSVDPSKEPLLDDAGVAFFMQGGRRGRVDAVEAGLLDSLNKPLVNTPFVVAYRFANEYALYEEALANLNGVPQLDSGEADEAKIAEYRKKVSEHAIEALDHVVLMKLLPRIHGMKDVVKGIFEGRKIDEKDVPGLKDEVKADGLSAGMMTEILKRSDEYLTFWP